MKPFNIAIIILFITSFVIHGTDDDFKQYQEFKKRFLKNVVEIDAGISLPNLDVDESGIYIIDKKYCTINVFDKTNGKEINVIGRKGEGPGEFLFISGLHFSKDLIFVSSPPKLSVFSKDGKLLYEKRTHLISSDGEFIPFGDNFLYMHFIGELTEKSYKVYLAYTILDQNLKKIKNIFKTPFNRPYATNKYRKPFLVFHECRKGMLYKDRFYIGNTELGFYIAVFDINGNKLFEIKKDFEKIPVDSSIKNKVMNNIKANDPHKIFLSQREVFFPDYFPAFLNFFIDKDKIFVFKFPKPGDKGKVEIVLLDLNGNALGQEKIPLGGLYGPLQNRDNYSFYNGEIYYLSIDENLLIHKLSLDEIYNYYFKVRDAQ